MDKDLKGKEGGGFVCHVAAAFQDKNKILVYALRENSARGAGCLVDNGEMGQKGAVLGR